MAGDGRVWKKKENELNKKKRKSSFHGQFSVKEFNGNLLCHMAEFFIFFFFFSLSFLCFPLFPPISFYSLITFFLLAIIQSVWLAYMQKATITNSFYFSFHFSFHVFFSKTFTREEIVLIILGNL